MRERARERFDGEEEDNNPGHEVRCSIFRSRTTPLIDEQSRRQRRTHAIAPSSDSMMRFGRTVSGIFGDTVLLVLCGGQYGRWLIR